jgi:large subunit ribosomal protein L9
VAWTTGGEKQVTQIRRARKAREIRDLDHAQEVKAALEGLTVTVAAKAGDAGRLFGSVQSADVALAVSKAGGPALDKRAVELRDVIKTTGTHKATVRLHPGVTASLTFEVVPA